MIKKLLIIPARIGSKRIKNKNIKKFFGKPIINYSIETALKSKIFDEIHVSTDSLKVKNILKKYPINIDFLRPKKLSGSKVGLIKVYEFIVKKFLDMGKKFDQIWFLTPCSPLIDTKDLISASKFIKKNKVRNLLAITEYPHPIQRAFKLSKSKKLSPEKKKNIIIRTQDFEKRYHDTGTFGVIDYNSLVKKKIIFKGFVIARNKGIDIDTIDDWKLAESLYKTKKILN